MTDISTDLPSENRKFQIQRRSTRVPIRVSIDVHGRGSACEGETVIVNMHGALIKTIEPLTIGEDVTVHVFLTGKAAAATVVFEDPEQELHFGIELHQPENIWGISLSGEDGETRPVDVEQQR